MTGTQSTQRQVPSASEFRPDEPPLGPGRSKVGEHAQRSLHLVADARGEGLGDESLELGERRLRHRAKTVRALGEEDEGCAAVARVGATLDEVVALEEAHHRRHRLLAQASTGGELTHAEAVLLEKGDEDRPVGRSDVRIAGSDELLVQELVPVLAGLREQEAEVLASRPASMALRLTPITRLCRNHTI
jgi:hypothetical protein